MKLKDTCCLKEAKLRANNNLSKDASKVSMACEHWLVFKSVRGKAEKKLCEETLKQGGSFRLSLKYAVHAEANTLIKWNWKRDEEG